MALKIKLLISIRGPNVPFIRLTPALFTYKTLRISLAPPNPYHNELRVYLDLVCFACLNVEAFSESRSVPSLKVVDSEAGTGVNGAMIVVSATSTERRQVHWNPHLMHKLPMFLYTHPIALYER